jgi:outer membrane protein assembly factor BamA
MNWKWFYSLICLMILAGSSASSQESVSPVKIYEQSTPEAGTRYRVRKISFIGNKTTKESVIRREMLIRENDTLFGEDLAERLAESRHNLLNTSLFNFVTVDTVATGEDPRLLDVSISFVERWYTWPFPIFKLTDRNFNTWWKTKDWSHTIYGFYIQQDNFRGRRESIRLSLFDGYQQVVGVTYTIPSINAAQTLGISFSTFFNRNHEVAYNSAENKLLYVKDANNFPYNTFTSGISLTYRPDIHYYHSLEIGYSRYNFSDTLIKLNTSYSFGNETHPDFFSLTWSFKADFRDFQPYPLEGYLLNLEVAKDGVDLSGKTKADLLTLYGSAKKYLNLGRRFFLAGSLTTKYSFLNNSPYFLQQGLGYQNDFVRGYEFYVVDGQDYALLKTNLKWNLLPVKVSRLPYIPTEKFSLVHYAFYLNAFIDAGYVRDKTYNDLNLLANQWIMGYGMGLDFVTYYDKVLRLEVSRNKLGETGFFMHFIAPI